jgi:hypothetical protein
MPAELYRALVLDRLAQRYGGRPTKWENSDVEDLRIANIAAFWDQAQSGGK